MKTTHRATGAAAGPSGLGLRGEWRFDRAAWRLARAGVSRAAWGRVTLVATPRWSVGAPRPAPGSSRSGRGAGVGPQTASPGDFPRRPASPRATQRWDADCCAPAPRLLGTGRGRGLDRAVSRRCRDPRISATSPLRGRGPTQAASVGGDSAAVDRGSFLRPASCAPGSRTPTGLTSGAPPTGLTSGAPRTVFCACRSAQ